MELKGIDGVLDTIVFFCIYCSKVSEMLTGQKVLFYTTLDYI